MKQTKWTKKRSEGLPRWAMGLLMGLCINLLFRVLLDHSYDPLHVGWQQNRSLLAIGSGGLVIYVLLTGGARKEFDELAQRVEKETVGLPAGQTPKAYADLKAENPDFVGWIKIEGTSVNYPVVQTKAEPQYYLRRSFEGSYSIAGTPFLDAQCDMEKGIGLIIYGHNMNDGSMFADIAGYTQETYWREHPIIQCDSLTRQREYEVMAVLQFKDSEQAAQDYYSVPRDEMNFTEYISRLADAALYDTGIQAVWGDQILALSTCSRQDSDSRILVIARKTGL